MENCKIVTHNGKAHLDDFLACCVLLYAYDGQLYRQSKPTEEDLNCSSTFVVDFGKNYTPEKRNFDHHQISGGAVCAFTMVLDYMGIRCYKALPWIKFVETWDHCGPQAAMSLLGSNKGCAPLLISPLEGYFLKEFSQFEGEVDVDFCAAMKSIGQQIVADYDRYWQTELNLKQNAKVINFNNLNIADYRLCDPNMMNFQCLEDFEQERMIDVIIAYNTRGWEKYRMLRKNENIDFNKAKGLEGVGFIHQSGFLICFDGDYKSILNKV